MLFCIVALAMSILTTLCQADTGWHIGDQLATPIYYLGDTPYQNQPFLSGNISTAFRIQRDIAMNVTIDQLVWPALDMSTAFFGKDFSIKRVSEVDQPLIMGYKRLVVDLYWDAIRSDWQLCPVPIQVNTTSKVDIVVDGYTCAPKFMFRDFMAAVNDYLVSTEVEKQPQLTSLITVILNLHELPAINNNKVTETTLGDTILHTISKSATNHLISRVYTPSSLATDRMNFSASLYAHGRNSIPFSQKDAIDSIWPQWLYLIEKKIQLLVGFGTIEQNANSSFTISQQDKSIIFDSISLGGIGGGMNLTFHTAIQTPPECTIEPISWSFVNDHDAIFNYQSALQTTQCGYSPYFTHANYSGQSSKIDGGHLADNVLSTIWSWEVNEPNSIDGKRCAAIKNANGRWIAHDCALSLRGACRLASDPDEWILTKNAVIYDRALSACPQNYVFDIPRIPRQNIKLWQAMIANNLTTDEQVWINLNLMYHDDLCWVIGRYGTCWWASDSGNAYLGLIKTSIVAGVIVLLLVGIFTWVKCARLWRNRNSKPRKAMVKAMLARREYNTVPA